MIRLRMKHNTADSSTTDNTPGGQMITSSNRIVYKALQHDAGFFANFNFMMSMNSEDRLVVPYWTNKTFGGHRHSTRHYNYWGHTPDENIFLRYFDVLIDYDIATLPAYNMKNDDCLTHVQPRYNMMHDDAAFTIVRHKYHKLYTNLFRPKESIMDKVNHFMMDKKNAIAVHVRNPVHDIEMMPLNFKDYFNAIEKFDDGIRPVLLATDNELTLLVFKEKFKERLVYFKESERSSIDMHLAWIQALRKGGREDDSGLINGKGFELHNAKCTTKDIAYDVVFEMLCLQQASILIGTVSNVVLVASYMNPHMPVIII
jgi:hypothetical protein